MTALSDILLSSVICQLKAKKYHNGPRPASQLGCPSAYDSTIPSAHPGTGKNYHPKANCKQSTALPFCRNMEMLDRDQINYQDVNIKIRKE